MRKKYQRFPPETDAGADHLALGPLPAVEHVHAAAYPDHYAAATPAGGGHAAAGSKEDDLHGAPLNMTPGTIKVVVVSRRG